MHRALSPALVGSCLSQSDTHTHTQPPLGTKSCRAWSHFSLPRPRAPESSSRRAWWRSLCSAAKRPFSALFVSLRASPFLPSSGCHKPWLGKMTASVPSSLPPSIASPISLSPGDQPDCSCLPLRSAPTPPKLPCACPVLLRLTFFAVPVGPSPLPLGRCTFYTSSLSYKDPRSVLHLSPLLPHPLQLFAAVPILSLSPLPLPNTPPPLSPSIHNLFSPFHGARSTTTQATATIQHSQLATSTSVIAQR